MSGIEINLRLAVIVALCVFAALIAELRSGPYLSRQSWLVRIPLWVLGAAVAMLVAYGSFLVAEAVGFYLGFGRQAAFWLAALTFVLPLEVLLVLWSTDEAQAGTFTGWIKSLGLKLATPLAMLLSGIVAIAVVSWMCAFAVSMAAWIVGSLGYGQTADYLRSLVMRTDAPYDRFSFENPWIPLLLLVLIPALVAISYRTMANLGRFRGTFAMGYRSRVLALLVLALAGFQLQRVTDRVTVIYLLDQSESIPQQIREVMIRYVVEDSRKHRHAGDLASASEDKAGVIIFGREATIEYPPLASEISAVSGLPESLFQVRTDATNISAALKLAQASFPEDTAKRIVIVTDGNENLGDAKTIASTLAENGIGIDVVPVQLNANAEVAVSKVGLPTDIRRGQPVEASVVVENFGKSDTAGTLRVTRTYGGQTEPLADQEVELRPGKNVFTFRHEIDVPAAYTYRADFIARDEGADALIQNNSATAYTHVRGKGRVLLIVDPSGRGQFEALKASLGEMNLEVEEMPSDRLFTSLAELQAFDCVVLANVPRSQIGTTVEDIDKSSSFTDEQIQMLVRNTEQFGSGLVMIGGPDSFGAGGWANTELEKAMPVDFQIKNAKVRAVGALAMMMHASEIPQGNHWQKVIGIEALKVLGPMDYCGVMHWDNFTGRDDWLWRDKAGRGLVQVGGQQKTMMAKLGRMQPGDMPDFEPAMKKTLNEMKACNASVKHAIIISDGDPAPPNNATIAGFKSAGIKISTVAVGAHGMIEDTRLRGIATATNGKFYRATNPKALPRIFQIEARKVARPLVKEDTNGMPVGIVDGTHEMVQNIDNVPPTKGFVLTEVKENPLVEVLMQANAKDVEARNATILATWTYGAGKTAVVTTDAGARWATDWPGWENYEKFYSQVIRNVMRPVNELGDFTIATDVKDGEVRVVVQALQKETGENLNFLNMSATGTDPKMGTVNFSMQQEAPGRYVGRFKADQAGSYLLAISPGKGFAPLLTGASVPYSAEYRERETNEALLLTLASHKPKGGQEKGKLFDTDLRPDNLETVTLVDTFRRTLPKAISSRDVWPLFLLIAAGVFFTDIFIRRVTVHFYWVAPALAWAYSRLLRRPQEQARDEVLERLRSRKAAVTSQIDERRAATRFEPVADQEAGQQRELGEVLADATAGGSSAPPRPAQTPAVAGTSPQEETTYTERLLAAKKKAKGK